MLFVTNPKEATERDVFILHIMPPIIVFLALLIATFWSWQSARNRYDKEYDEAVNQSISAVERDIRERMAHHEAALQSSAGLFRSSASVTRGEWDEFQKMFRDENRFLGTSNVVFALAVPRSELDEHIYDMKRQGFSNYRVYPETSQDLIAPVIYPVSAVTKKNYQEVKPFGFNILSDPKRLQAANQAVEQKRAILSDRITLIRDDGDTAPAFTMILPVYRQSNRDGEVDESNIYGFVYVPLMAETMFNEIFASNNTVNIGMQVYDGDVSPDNLIYENDSFNEPGVGDMITRDLQVNNHQWQIVYKPLESAISQNIRRGPLGAIIGGTIFSMLIAGLVWMLLVSRTRSITINEEREIAQAKDDILSIASHQLRTPATGVKQYVGMLLSGFVGDLTRQQKRMLKEAYESNERQLIIIDEMLHVARIDAGRLNLQHQDTNISQLIRRIVREHAATLKERGQTVELDMPKKAIHLQADPQYLRMALENIISNASKYSFSDTKIFIKLRNRQAYVSISVKDEGVGIARRDHPQIFQKFSRIYNELSRKTAGSGMGLYITKKIIDLHGGTITFQSDIGKGTTFKVRLPYDSTTKLKYSSNM